MVMVSLIPDYLVLYPVYAGYPLAPQGFRIAFTAESGVGPNLG